MSDSAEAKTLTSMTGVRLPPDGRITYFYNGTGGDPLIRATIEMSAAALDTMLSDNNWSKDAFSPANHNFLGRDDGDWKPRSRPPFPVMSRDPVNGEFLYVGYEPKGDGVLVYLLWFRS